MGRRLVAMRRRRLARDEDEQNALFAARASQDFWNAARLSADAPTPAETSNTPRTLPFVGPGAPAPADRSSLAEEEWNFSRAGNASGGAGKAAAGASAAPARPEKRAASPPPGGGAAVLRSPGATKAGLATGSQAAVVKLASYGAGSVRAGALLNYQSHKGELALEREDGTLVFGKQAVGDLAAQWRDEADGREPSNDVLAFTLTFAEAATPEHVREALGDALKGHAFAWRMEETQIHVVIVAAGAERGESGKLERIYPNEKSLTRLHDRIDGALNIDTSRSEARWAHGVEGATTELANLTKGGQIAAETFGGLAIDEAAARLFLQRTRVASDAKAKGFNANLELAKSWERGMRSQGRRDFAHVILSAKAGTDKEAFMDAARATLAKEFEGHEYVFVMHTNRQHIHVHAAVRLTNAEGKKIDPRIADFSRWRSILAEEARERHIPMESVRRFDQAHAPGYKLKDVNMVERGIAPEAARRRIERVKNKEIHRPTRPEGRHRANEAARQWSNLAERKVFGALPPLAEGAMRLYRADPVAAESAHKTMMFTSDRAIAEQIAQKVQSRLVFLDVPASRLAEVLSARNQPDTIYAVPVALGSLSREPERIDSAAILPFQRRAEAALEPILLRENSIEIAKGEVSLRTVETMTTAREDIVGALTRISDLLPEGAEKAAFEIERRRLVELSQEIIASQAKLETLPVKLEGDRDVQPKPTDTKNALITHERKGDEIHYSRHDAATGALQTLAFVDQGKQLDVKDWKNPDTVLAALQVASTKWETVTVDGNDAYKETAARLAAEHGFKITNPEMQGRIQQLRAEAESKKALLAEGAPEVEKTQARPAPAITTTPAERSLHLANIREQVDLEAERETTQAGAAAKAHETSRAKSDAATPERAPQEAAAAREAARTVDSDESTPMQPNPAQSEEMQQLRHAQQRVLTQEQRDRQELAVQNRDEFKRKQSQKPQEESEGESQ
jgi:hypothetical protein